MDAGIINAFKVHYKQLCIHQVIHDFDRSIEEPSNMVVKTVWDNISAETIKNCYHYTRILPLEHLVKIFLEIEPAFDEDPKTQIIQIPEVTTALFEIQELIDLTNDTHLQQITQEYFDYDEFIDTKEALDNERIIEFVKNPVVSDNEPDNFVDEEPKITFTETKKSLNQLLSFTCQQPFMTNSFIKKNDEAFFHDFLSRTYRASVRFMKQKTLEHLIIHE
ncbi:hypothetical protein C2G38_2298292 [Gigaspora rosea]|uniref:DDE-1 domain-containing protein n=1 Tax=Gigaspora rosea TaxID=44941 RepID=A0A397VKH6_9GLOM|nr:hypothetical protein C2G38_2298292 [Gigaspora rosea]